MQQKGIITSIAVLLVLKLVLRRLCNKINRNIKLKTGFSKNNFYIRKVGVVDVNHRMLMF
jgi:hypothetical protein